MGRNWLALLLAVSLVVNGVLFALLLRQRTGTMDAEVAAASEHLTELEAADSGQPLPLPTDTAVPTRSIVAPMVVRSTPTEMASPVAPSPTDEPLPTPTDEPPPTPTDEPPPTPTDEPPPSPTAVPEPTRTPEPPQPPTLEPAGTDWLRYINTFRLSANLPPLLENVQWSLDSEAHSRYMTYTGHLSHNQDPGSQYYSRSGQSAGENGNIASGFIGSAPFQWAINYWMSAPFHAVPMLDPQLATTGFAEYRDPAGVSPLTATLDVRRGLGVLPGGVQFPILFPGDGGLTWVLRYSLPEFPEALSTCPGYVQPTGAPIIVQIGDGRETPRVAATALSKDGEYLAHCRFDETNYTHPNEFRQTGARAILDQRDAIVIIPQQPLLPDETYTVRVDVNGQTYNWSFRTAASAP